MVEQLATHHELAQHGERRGGLAVGIGPKLHDGVRLRHDRHLVRGAHVARDVGKHIGVFPEGREAGVPFDLGEILEKGVQPLVHPSPLPLVTVDDHREIDVPDLVDDDADQAVLGAAGIGDLAGLLIRCRTVTVEGDHWIFHAAPFPAVDRDRNRIRVSKGIA